MDVHLILRVHFRRSALSTTRIEQSDPSKRQSESRGHAHLHAPSLSSRDEGEGVLVFSTVNTNKNFYNSYLPFASNKPDCRTVFYSLTTTC